MTPIAIRDKILLLMTDKSFGWSLHPDCLARALGYKTARALSNPGARWRLLKLDEETQALISRRLEMILEGEIKPTAIQRVKKNGVNCYGPVPPTIYLDWVPAVADDAWRKSFASRKRKMALSVNLKHRGFSLGRH